MSHSTARTRKTTGSTDPAPKEARCGEGERLSREDEELDALALEYGIEPAFTDARGDIQQTAQQTKRGLLAALGVCADGVADVRAALDRCEAARWQRALPPVVVAPVHSIEIPIALTQGTRDLTWRVSLEAGGEQSATVSFAALPLIAAQDRDGRSFERRTLRLAAELPHGYHRLSIDAVEGTMSLIVTPDACWLPPAIRSGGRLGGIAVQLYLLRSAANWGIGDFTDLRTLVELIAARGGDAVGLNPLHQVFLDDPEHASPYSPASRLLLNTLNIDVTAIPEFATSADADRRVHEPEFSAALAALRAAQLVDYAAVAARKLELLRLLFAAFNASATRDRRNAFARYRASVTETVERTYVFFALRDFFAARDKDAAPWQHWPPEYRDPASAAVAQFARDNAAQVTFFAWLQWIADAQLEAVSAAAQPMRVGLYRDLAVGVDPAGAETWCDQRAIVQAARIGAPPDINIPLGQNWDLPPYNPHVLRAEGYASFIELVRANMRHAGALRIDHAMALQHVFWIPQGAGPKDGAYLRYPLDDLLGILALESQRAHCVVVGEALGTVPAGFCERMVRANVLAYRVLFFERDDAANYCPPARYPRAALAVLGSHDLPTLRAWWTADDIRLQARLGLYPDAAVVNAQLEARAADRDGFVAALRSAGVLEAHTPLDAETLFTAAHAFLAKTASALALAQFDDIAGETDPVNVPTTSDQYPNWRRRLALTLEALDANPRFVTLCEILRAADRLRM